MFNMDCGHIEQVDGRDYFAVAQGVPGTPVFGPYARLARGSHVAAFMLLLDTDDTVPSAASEAFGSVDVCSDNGCLILAQTSLTIKDFGNRAVRILLAFQISEDKFIELRVHTLGLHAFRIAVDREIRTIRDYGSSQYKSFVDMDHSSSESHSLEETLTILYERGFVAYSSVNTETLRLEQRRKFDQAVSLGAWCQVTEQLKNNKINYAISPFDWLVTPFQSLLDVLSDSGKRLLTSFELNSRGDTIVCKEYGVLYHHEFSRTADGTIVIDDETVANSKGKLSHKMKRMNAACAGDKSTLFIRLGGFGLPAEATPYNLEDVPFPTSNLSTLADLIEEAYPGLNFSVLFVYFAETTEVVYDCVSDARILVREIPWPKEPPVWEGDSEDWRRIFHEFEFAGCHDPL